MESRKTTGHFHAGDAEYSNIAANSNFIMTCTGNVTVTNMGDNCHIILIDQGNLTIQGTIGENLSVQHNGSGTLTLINPPLKTAIVSLYHDRVIIKRSNLLENNKNKPKIVCDDGLITIIWNGRKTMYRGITATITDNVVYVDGEEVTKDHDRFIFDEPENAVPEIISSDINNNVNNIAPPKIESDKQGLVYVTMNGFRTAYAGIKAKIKNNKVYVDKKEVIENDHRIIYVEVQDATLANCTINDSLNNASSNALIQSFFQSQREIEKTVAKKTLVESQIILDDYSPATKNYIDSFKNKIRFQDQIKDLTLTPEQDSWLEAYRDPISFEVINIPVTLHEVLYDLNTLLQAYERNKTAPITLMPFVLRDIQSARIGAEALQEMITKIKEAHSDTQVLEQFSPKPKGF